VYKVAPAAVQFFVQSNPGLRRWTVQFHNDAVDEIVWQILRNDFQLMISDDAGDLGPQPSNSFRQ